MYAEALLERSVLTLESRRSRRAEGQGRPPHRISSQNARGGVEPPDGSEISRRKLLIGVAAGGLAIGGGIWFVRNESSHEQLPGAAETLIESIDRLAPSLIKTLLSKRIVPYFKAKTPFIETQGDFKFPVYDVTITEQTISTNVVNGDYSERANSQPAGFKLTQDMVIPIPLGPLTQQASVRSQFGKDHLTSDGTPFSTVLFSKGDTVYEGISPHINIFPPVMDQVSPDLRSFVKAATTFAYVKEACSFLLDDLLNEDTFNTLRTNNLPTAVTAMSQKGNTPTQIEIVHQLTSDVYNHGGAWKAAIDIGGYLVALKAYENTDLLQQLTKDNTILSVINLLPTLNLGSDGRSLLYSSIKWAYDHPEANQVAHKGNLYQIP